MNHILSSHNDILFSTFWIDQIFQRNRHISFDVLDDQTLPAVVQPWLELLVFHRLVIQTTER